MERKIIINTSELAIWYARQSGKRKLATRASTHAREPRLRKVFVFFRRFFFALFLCSPANYLHLNWRLLWSGFWARLSFLSHLRCVRIFFFFFCFFFLLVSPYFLALSTVLDDCCLIFNGFQICGRWMFRCLSGVFVCAAVSVYVIRCGTAKNSIRQRDWQFASIGCGATYVYIPCLCGNNSFAKHVKHTHPLYPFSVRVYTIRMLSPFLFVVS